ncbi:hypothetical protein F0562_020494 [Nyssa sinensis]|uniref:Uncharacterized protein n=1 Tax=Nyssa sinensis TaxID=561372 RepID=A0A5J5BSU9_9ASTE|nr:hypothetical protein F0562_020494 [Nyssa sinensis]
MTRHTVIGITLSYGDNVTSTSSLGEPTTGQIDESDPYMHWYRVITRRLIGPPFYKPSGFQPMASIRELLKDTMARIYQLSLNIDQGVTFPRDLKDTIRKIRNMSSTCLEVVYEKRRLRANPLIIMGIRIPGVLNAKQIIRRSLLTAGASNVIDVPKGYLAVYVGESQKRRFLVPISYLNQPLFQELLHMAEEEYGFDHPMGGLAIPCTEDTFLDFTSRLSAL